MAAGWLEMVLGTSCEEELVPITPLAAMLSSVLEVNYGEGLIVNTSASASASTQLVSTRKVLIFFLTFLNILL